MGYDRVELVFDPDDLDAPVGGYCWEHGGWQDLFGVDPGKRHLESATA